MRRTAAMLGCLSALAVLSSASAMARSRDAKDCIGFIRNEQPSKETVLGWLVNNCPDRHVAVVHEFDVDVYGNRREGPWCRNPSGQWHLPVANILEPGEKLGVGWQLHGLAERLDIAACEVDTSKNNSVFFILQQPEFLFEADCSYQCR